MERLFEIASNLSTPIGLAGFFAAVFFYSIRSLVRANIFPTLSKALSSDIIKLIIDRLFILSLVAMILGFAGYVVSLFASTRSHEPSETRYKAYVSPPKPEPMPPSIPPVNVTPPVGTTPEQTRTQSRHTEPPKQPAPVAPASQPTINAPYGVAIGGNNTGTATVNNYAPPNRHLTETQISTLDTVVASLPERASEYVYVKNVNDLETLRYSAEISAIFKRHNKLKNVLTALSWSGPPPEGVFVVVHDQNDDNFPVAQKIADAMNKSGIQLTFTAAEWAKKGEVWIVFGTRPER